MTVISVKSTEHVSTLSVNYRERFASLSDRVIAFAFPAAVFVLPRAFSPDSALLLCVTAKAR
jgi:hypothetical protein